jgi:hypothetical protein
MFQQHFNLNKTINLTGLIVFLILIYSSVTQWGHRKVSSLLRTPTGVQYIKWTQLLQWQPSLPHHILPILQRWLICSLIFLPVWTCCIHSKDHHCQCLTAHFQYLILKPDLYKMDQAVETFILTWFYLLLGIDF